MRDDGVFAVHRGVFDHGFFADEPYTERLAWIWLVGSATWRPSRVRVKDSMFSLERGQCAFSLRFLAKKWGWSKDKVARFFERLKTETMIETQARRDATIITICNYNKHQLTPGYLKDIKRDTDCDAGETQARRRRDKEEQVNKGNKENNSISELRSESAPDVPRETNSKPKRAKARTPIADDWAPSERDTSHAASLGFTTDQISTMAAGFADHHRARGNLMADWSAAWRTWCGNEIKFGRSSGNGQGRSRSFQDDRLSVSKANDRLRQELERGAIQFPARPSLVHDAGQGDLRLIPKG